MSVSMKCDRCGLALHSDLPDTVLRQRLSQTGVRFDLCVACTAMLRVWVTDGPNATRGTAEVLPQRTPTSMTLPRPSECFEGEDTYRWLLAEARWLAGPVIDAMHRIRRRENTFEHDSVQRDCDEGHPPPDQA